MKKVMMLLVCGLILGSTPVQAKNSISVNLTNLAVGLMGAQFEIGLKNEKASIPIRLHGFSFGTSVAGVAGSTFSAFAIGASYRMYKEGKIANSFYYGPRLDLWMAKIESTFLDATVATGKGTLFGPGFEVGRAWTFGGNTAGFMVDLTFLVSYYAGKVEAEAKNTTIPKEEFKFGGILPGARIAIGYAF